jgi:hypothetical protein
MKRVLALLMTAVLSAAALAEDGGRTWATAISTRPADGRQIVFRFIHDFDPTFIRSTYPHRVIVVWRYTSDSGMPSRAEQESMDQLEGLLSPGLQESLLASLMLVSTGNNLREWTYYTKSEQEFMLKLNHALRQSASFPIEVHAARDPEWRTYETFRRGLKP